MHALLIHYLTGLGTIAGCLAYLTGMSFLLIHADKNER